MLLPTSMIRAHGRNVMTTAVEIILVINIRGIVVYKAQHIASDEMGEFLFIFFQFIFEFVFIFLNTRRYLTKKKYQKCKCQTIPVKSYTVFSREQNKKEIEAPTYKKKT